MSYVKSVDADLDCHSANHDIEMRHASAATIVGSESAEATMRAAAAPANPSASYDGSRAIYRLLRVAAWGSPLMNQGYFGFRGPFAFLNLLVLLEKNKRTNSLQFGGTSVG